MDWIKRNLFFAIFSAVALGLMGLAGWYTYSKWALNSTVMESLNADYATLGNLNKAPILPGNSKTNDPANGDINNTMAAKQQEQLVRQFIDQSRAHFQRIAPIPDLPKISDQDFSTALGRTLDRLQKDATNSSVTIESGYSFSFQAEKSTVRFSAAGLQPLSVQLGEVKAICEILFEAKVNSLDNLRRERVSNDDSSGPQTDYLPERSVTNNLAILTPYELTFKCFSPELASVLSGFACSPYGLVVKTINVKSAPSSAVETSNIASPTQVMPQPYTYAPSPRSQEAEAAAAYARRYGGGGPMRRPMPQQPTYVPAPAAAPPVNKGPAIVLDEKQLEVTINLVIVKLLPAK